MRLPKDKLEDFTEMLNSWSIKTRATEHELSVLAGKLLYACNVIFAGRLFLNRCFAIKRFASRFDQPIIFLRISSLISAGGSPQLKLGMEFLSWYPNPLCTYLWMRRQMGGLMENQDSADTITSLTSIFLVLRFRNSRILRSQTWNCSPTLSRSDFGPTPGNTNRSQWEYIKKCGRIIALKGMSQWGLGHRGEVRWKSDKSWEPGKIIKI